MDLNIDNYSLHELLRLFKLPENFTAKQLKEAPLIIWVASNLIHCSVKSSMMCCIMTNVLPDCK